MGDVGGGIGAFISLAFQWRGALTDLSPLHGALELAGFELLSPGPCEEGQCVSAWRLANAAGQPCEITCRCFDAGTHVATTLDVLEDRFDDIAARIGRSRLIAIFVKIGAGLMRALGLSYVFFEQEAEADLDPDTYDGTRLFGITLVPEHAPWAQRAVQRDDIQRIDREPGAIVIYRRLDPVPHRG